MLVFSVWRFEIESQQLYQHHNMLYLETACYSGIESIVNLVAAVRGQHSINSSSQTRKATHICQTGFIVRFTPLMHLFLTRPVEAEADWTWSGCLMFNKESRSVRCGSTNTVCILWIALLRKVVHFFSVKMNVHKAQHVVVCAREWAGGGLGLHIT